MLASGKPQRLPPTSLPPHLAGNCWMEFYVLMRLLGLYGSTVTVLIGIPLSQERLK